MKMKKLLGIVFVILYHSLLAHETSALTKTNVVIIGAGMSGMAAARTLHEAGVKDILILEATDRIGGRVKKTQFSGHTVEMGANWLFSGGPVFNPVLDMAQKLNIRTTLSYYDNATANTYKQEGGLYPKEEVDAIDEVATARDEFCANFSRLLSANEKEDIDVSILAAQRIFKEEPITPLEMLIDSFHNDFEDGEPPKVTSLKHTYPRNEIEDHGEDENFVCDPRGFEIVVQYVAKQFLSSLTNDPRLKLNKVVREVHYTKNGVVIVTEDGEIFVANHAIVTVSVGVLQSNLIEFNPELPLWKRIAISDFSMTIYTKIFLKFPYTFWPTGPGTQFFLYTHVRRGYYPFWQHLEDEYPGSNLVFVTVTADESRRVEKLSDDEIKAEIMEVMRKMFGNDIPEPEDILVPRWGSNRFYRGSYSNFPSNYNQAKHDDLGRPVGRLYFTGEHTSNKYIGYVDGAYLAGIDAANDLLGCMKNQTCRGYNKSLPLQEMEAIDMQSILASTKGKSAA